MSPCQCLPFPEPSWEPVGGSLGNAVCEAPYDTEQSKEGWEHS